MYIKWFNSLYIRTYDFFYYLGQEPADYYLSDLLSCLIQLMSTKPADRTQNKTMVNTRDMIFPLVYLLITMFQYVFVLIIYR